MYSRNVEKAPDFLIANGKAKFGSYYSSPRSLSISGVKFPYGVVPMPTFITNMRIRSNFSFVFNASEYLGTVDIIGVKIAGFYEINVYSKKTGKRFSYRGVTGFHRHFIPKNLEKAICSTYKKHRYVRFAWDKNKNRFSFVFHMKGNAVFPNFDANFISAYNDKTPVFTSVIPAPTTRRCYVSYQRVIDASAGFFSSREDENPFFVPEKASCLLSSTRGYYKLRVLSDYVTGLGEVENHSVVFRFSNVSCNTKDDNKYNENALFFDDELTAMPPVMITHPFGISKNWVIQDTEGMVDLVFTPSSVRQKYLSCFFLDAQYSFIFGTFEGVVVTKGGVSVTLKEFPGIVKNLRTRL